MNRTYATAPIAAAILTGLAFGVAHAQDIPQEGQIEAVVTDVTTATGLEMSGERMLYALDSVLVVHGDDAGILDRMTGHCLGLEQVNPGSGGARLTGHCTYVDADGDKIFEEVSMERSGSGPVSGTATLTGGTGKFEGITGELTKTRLLLPSPADGVFPGIGELSGSYTIE